MFTQEMSEQTKGNGCINEKQGRPRIIYIVVSINMIVSIIIVLIIVISTIVISIITITRQ